MKTPLFLRGLAADRGPALDAVPAPLLEPTRWLAALTWLRAGWSDLRALPILSLSLGSLVAAGMWAGETLVDRVPQLTMPSVLACIALAPFVLAIFFSVSRPRRAGYEVRMGAALNEVRHSALALATLSLVLVLVAVVGLRLTAIAIALSMGPAIPAEILTELSSGGIVPTFAYFVGSAAVAGVIFALATFGVPAVYARNDGVFSSMGTGLQLLRENRVAMGGWVIVIVAVGALAAWVTPVVLVVGFPLVAYANWHAFSMSRQHTAPSQHA